MRIHHDGSALYVDQSAPRLGDEVGVRVRVPRDTGHPLVRSVRVRSVIDGEPVFATLERCEAPTGTVAADDWWAGMVAVDHPLTRYRFLAVDADDRQLWLNAAGLHDQAVPDHSDFQLSTATPPPAWLSSRVAYQVFPDRFASSGRSPRPPWAVPAEWSDPVLTGRESAMRQWFGGDLWGLLDRVDHLERVGVNLLYTTPFFPAESNHRYDASSFDRVDPALGGDDALIALARELHARDIRLVGDLTLNHCGATHPWFLRAADPEAAEHAYFHRHSDGTVACWFDVPSLPKLDHRSQDLARHLNDGPDSVVARWLQPPFQLDGWRIDVANMAGRFGDVDLAHELARRTRSTMAEAAPDAYLVAEHGHDAGGDLSGDGWHGTMNYAGFTQPVWAFLRDPARTPGFMASPAGVPRLDGAAVAGTIDSFRATMPWRSHVASLTQLGSHDTERWRSVAGSAGRAGAGLVMLMTFPGVPTLFSGDEVGVEGVDHEDARRPFPWDESQWDHRLLELVQSLSRLRRTSPALRQGGFRWAHVDRDVLCYLRETHDERLLVRIARTSHRPIALRPSLAGPGAVHLVGTSHAEWTDGRLTLRGDTGGDVWRLSS